MSDRTRSPLVFGTVVVIGGGCYGSYYVRQLQRGAAAGAVRIARLLVVDRDPACRVTTEVGRAAALPVEYESAEWAPFLGAYLGRASEHPASAAADAIVPSPLMPHLLYQWIAARAQERWPRRGVRAAPVDAELPVPWQRPADDGTRYASFATWMCPVNCIEPARCPHTGGPRDWSMPVAIRRHTTAARTVGGAGPYLFHCTHRTFGVGMIDVASVLAADADLARWGAAGPIDTLVGTVSHCHGAVSRLVIDGDELN